MDRILKTGPGWRIGWDPNASEFRGLVGTDEWSIELTEDEFQDFSQLLGQLADSMHQMQFELMDAETIAIEAESDRLWLEVEGYPAAYGLRMIVLTGRRADGAWAAESVPGLIEGVRSLFIV